jgi:hypothetical protein
MPTSVKNAYNESTNSDFYDIPYPYIYPLRFAAHICTKLYPSYDVGVSFFGIRVSVATSSSSLLLPIEKIRRLKCCLKGVKSVFRSITASWVVFSSVFESARLSEIVIFRCTDVGAT